MSYRCQQCNEPQKGSPIVMVIEVRRKEYSDTNAIGSEIVKEKRCCPPCSEEVVQAQRKARLEREEMQALEKAKELKAKPFEGMVYSA